MKRGKGWDGEREERRGREEEGGDNLESVINSTPALSVEFSVMESVNNSRPRGTEEHRVMR